MVRACMLCLHLSVLSVACCGFARLSCWTEGAVSCTAASLEVGGCCTCAPCSPTPLAPPPHPSSLLAPCRRQVLSAQHLWHPVGAGGFNNLFGGFVLREQQGSSTQRQGAWAAWRGVRQASAFTCRWPVRPPQAVSDTMWTCHCLSPLHGRRHGSRLPTHCCRSGTRRARGAAPAVAKSSSR